MLWSFSRRRVTGRADRHISKGSALSVKVSGPPLMTRSLLGEYKAELFLAGFESHMTSCQQTNRQEEVSWLSENHRSSQSILNPYVTIWTMRKTLLNTDKSVLEAKY